MRASFGARASPQNFAADQAIIAVTKKNAAPLKRLIAWLDSARDVVDGWPVLVVDDEADHAGLNTIQGENRRTRINDLIIQLLDRDRVTYVGYTATPYANLLADTRPVHTDHGNVVPGLYPKTSSSRWSDRRITSVPNGSLAESDFRSSRTSGRSRSTSSG